MPRPLQKQPFFADLIMHIGQHYRAVGAEFISLDDTELAWRPTPGE